MRWCTFGRCIQFMREQLDKLQYKTYHQTLKDQRAAELAAQFNQYHSCVLFHIQRAYMRKH